MNLFRRISRSFSPKMIGQSCYLFIMDPFVIKGDEGLGSPGLHTALQRSNLAILVLTGITILKFLQDLLPAPFGILFQPGLNVIPDIGERIRPGQPPTRTS